MRTSWVFLGLVALTTSFGAMGCGGGGGEGGNPDAAAVIGKDANSAEYGQASSDMMNKMHSMPAAGGKAAK